MEKQFREVLNLSSVAITGSNIKKMFVGTSMWMTKIHVARKFRSNGF